MNKTRGIRLIAVLLMAVMMLSAACAATPSDSAEGADTTTGAAADSPSSDTTAAAVESTPAETELTPDLPDVDYTGKTITILEREVQIGGNIDVYFNEYYGDIAIGETMNDAVYNRNMAVTDKYGVEIESHRELNADLKKVFVNASNAGDSICHVISANGNDTMSLAVGGYLRDVNTLDYVNYDNPWWMGMAMETSSIAGKNAFLLGDVNLQAFTAVEAVYFNKQLVLDLELDDLYTVVKDGKWTIDKMHEYCIAAVAELDGDGNMTKEDRYGFIFNNHSWQPFFYGSGLCIVEKDSNDYPELMLQSEHVSAVLSKVLDFLSDDDVMACSAWITMDGSMEQGFQTGHSLFYAQLMYSALGMRSGELDFGILPVPKYSESQEEHYSYVHQKSSYTTIPKTNEELEMTGILLEEMAYQAYKLVRPQFFDVMLDGKVANDAESWDMLDLIYKNVYVCLLQPMSSVGLDVDSCTRVFISHKKGSSTMASTYKSNERTWKRTLSQVADAFSAKVE